MRHAYQLVPGDVIMGMGTVAEEITVTGNAVLVKFVESPLETAFHRNVLVSTESSSPLGDLRHG